MELTPPQRLLVEALRSGHTLAREAPAKGSPYPDRCVLRAKGKKPKTVSRTVVAELARKRAIRLQVGGT